MVEKAEEGEMLPPSEQTMQRLGTMRRRAEEVVASLQKCKSMGVTNPKDPTEVQDEVRSLSLRMEGALKSDLSISRRTDEGEAIVDEAGYQNGGLRENEDSEAAQDEARVHENGGEKAAEGEDVETPKGEGASQRQSPVASAAPAARRRWQDAVQRVQQSPTQGSQKWTHILETLLEESGDDMPKQEAPQKKHLARLPSVAFTGPP